MNTFRDRLLSTARKNDSWLCVGLDPDPARLPGKAAAAQEMADFLIEVIDATRGLACAYKPNAAFFEALGESGADGLKRVIDHAARHAPVILDGKRGDIGNTANAYAAWAFDVLGADATTVSPYMGHDSVEPFTRRADRGVFILARTSNPGAADLQTLPLASGELVYEHIARVATTAWNPHGNVGLVVGATAPEELRRVRAIIGEEPFLLIPGVGAQGGSAEAAIRLGGNARGEGAIVNASRSIIYAESPEKAARELRDELNRHRT